VKSSTDNADGNAQSAATSPCPKCHHGTLVKRQNKFGKYFYACDDYPKCKYMLNSAPVDTACESCGWKMMVQVDKNEAEKGLICPQVNCQHKQTL
jgi:putative DNA topoisomerase